MSKKARIFLCFMFYFVSINVMSADLSLQSPAFLSQTFIPKQYTCQGANYSPALHWTGAPSATQTYVLMVDDPDAPKGSWSHWLLFNIPNTVNHLDAATSLPRGAISGKNSWGKQGYSGPCPPSGTHRYIFTLYALDTRLTVNSNVNKDDIINAMQDHILGHAQLIGLFSFSQMSTAPQ